MRQIAKKGDMALVVGLQSSSWNGRVIGVTSDPYITNRRSRDGLHAPELCNWTDAPSFDGSKPKSVCPTRCLIPIQPDSESKRLFADEPIEQERIV